MGLCSVGMGRAKAAAENSLLAQASTATVPAVLPLAGAACNDRNPPWLPRGPLHQHPRPTWVFSRLGAMESISSMKMMAGAFFSASCWLERKEAGNSGEPNSR